MPHKITYATTTPVGYPAYNELSLPVKPAGMIEIAQLGDNVFGDSIADDSENIVLLQNYIENAQSELDFHRDRVAATAGEQAVRGFDRESSRQVWDLDEPYQEPTLTSGDRRMLWLLDGAVKVAKTDLYNSKMKQTEALDETRATIAELLHFQKQKVNLLLDEIATPHFMRLKNGNNNETASQTWADWLSDIITGASDEQLINFLQWHEHTNETLASNPEIKAEIEKLKQDYRLEVAKAVANRWLVEPEAEDYGAQVDGVVIRLGDYFDTLLKGWLGYKDDEGVTVALGYGKNAIKYTLYYLQRALKHEFNHKILQDFTRDDPRWWYESVTEYINLALTHGYTDSFKPYLHGSGKDDGSYDTERALTHVVLTGGSKHIAARMATRAYSGSDQENAELRQAIDASWGIAGTLELIDKAVEAEIALLHERKADSDVSDLLDLDLMHLAAKKVSRQLLVHPEKVFGQALPKSVERKLAMKRMGSTVVATPDILGRIGARIQAALRGKVR